MKYPPYTDEQIANARWCWFIDHTFIAFGVAIPDTHSPFHYHCFRAQSWYKKVKGEAESVFQCDTNIAFDSEADLLRLSESLMFLCDAASICAQRIQQECKERMGDGK